MIQYEIEVKTGSLSHAGTDHEVKIEIVGSENRTRLRKLDRIAINDFERNQIDRFKKKDIDIGEIEFIGLLLSSHGQLIDDPWYVETIKIGKKVKSEESEQDFDTVEELIVVWQEFPIYSWILPHSEVQYFFTNKTSVPQKESATRKFNTMRDQRIMKNIVSWMPLETKLRMFPGYIDTKSHDMLNLNLRFTDNKDRDFQSNRRQVLRNVTFTTVRNKFKQFYELEDYAKAAKRLRENLDEIPYLENDLWKKDEEFGRQILNGMNPSMIIRVKDNLPENFPVTNDMVGEFLTRGLTLEEEVMQGNIYLINHDILEGVPTGNYPCGGSGEESKLDLAVPFCLFYNGTDDRLRPIAIQLGQEPGPKFPIWTPNDGEHAWLLAKIWFRNADYQVHQMVSHLAYTHLLIEPFAVATFRCLPPQHPIHKLLREHLQFVIAINTIGRARLISKVEYGVHLYFDRTFIGRPSIRVTNASLIIL